MAELTDNQTDVLYALEDQPRWLRPLDIGGRDGSHHSATLASLVRKGLVERRGRSFGGRGSYLYRITPAGQASLLSEGGDNR